jgi:hypothetical protein
VIAGSLLSLRPFHFGEQENLINEHLEVAARLKKRKEAFGAESRTNLRPAGIAE